MTTWSAHQLSVGYRRTVIGADFRILQSSGDVVSTQSEKTTNRDSSTTATLDPDIWPSVSQTERLDSTNGFNLENFPLSSSLRDVIESSADLIVFDIPELLAQNLADTFGLMPVPLGQIPDSNFLGFDVVDVRTQASAFHSFDWSRSELRELLAAQVIALNQYGLLETESDAIRSSIEFDSLISSHSPFAPCGVWRIIKGESKAKASKGPASK